MKGEPVIIPASLARHLTQLQAELHSCSERDTQLVPKISQLRPFISQQT